MKDSRRTADYEAMHTVASGSDRVEVDAAVLVLARCGDGKSRATGSAQVNSRMNADVRNVYFRSRMPGESILYRHHALPCRVSVASE